MSRLPGNISNAGTGIRRRKHLGWRTFDIKGPDVVEDNNDNHLSSSATINGNTVVTFNGACTTNTEHGIDMCVFGQPLTNNYGEPINFNDPFSFKFQVEFISLTGDYYNGENGDEVIPCFGIGIGQNGSDFKNTNNHWIMSGFHVHSDASPPQLRMYNSRANQETSKSSNRSSALSAGSGLLHGTIYVGPAVGTNRDAESVSIMTNATEFSGSSFAYNTGPTGTKYDLAQDAATFDSDGQVYVYAFFGTFKTNLVAPDLPSEAGSYGSKTEPVLTCRLRYLVASDPGGWGGSGT